LNQPGYKKTVPFQNLIDGQGIEVEVENTPVLLFRRGDQVYATGIYCPHADVVLDPRNCFGDLIVCKAHGYKSNIKTGECLNEPDVKLLTYPAVIEEDVVWLKMF
jgi:nitrite reductase/ring-hydroxylating ferredoxin subunit